MAQRSNTHPIIGSDQECRAAQSELDALLGGGPTDAARVDELIELIENYQGNARFVPDWSGEPYQNAA